MTAPMDTQHGGEKSTLEKGPWEAIAEGRKLGLLQGGVPYLVIQY